MAAGSGMISSAANSEDKKLRLSIDELQRELIEKAQRSGLTPEIRELSETVETTRRILTRKNFELNVLETLALESNDENISSLREQLFTTVKLIHQDLINEIMINEYRDETIELGLIHESLATNDMDMNKDNLTIKIRRWFYKRKKMREQLKQYRKNLNIKMDLEGY